MNLEIDIETIVEKTAKKNKNWDFANKILYDLCSNEEKIIKIHCLNFLWYNSF